MDPPDLGRIGIFAVAAEAQGKGLGHRLVDAALTWLARQGAARVTVVTQGRNSQAQRVYQRAGFRTHLVELWYHCWNGEWRMKNELARLSLPFSILHSSFSILETDL
jgi:RimJ/RimL family protein N-acetyltransferase